jgi:hypothetical protein
LDERLTSTSVFDRLVGEETSADTNDWPFIGVICFCARRCLSISIARCLALLIASELAVFVKLTNCFGEETEKKKNSSIMNNDRKHYSFW